MRALDEKIEAEVGKFLDRHLWDRLPVGYSRITDKTLQFKGCDLSTDNHVYDEKVKYYNVLNQAIQYPSFEITTKNRLGEYVDGWFVKDGQINDKYMLISIGTSETDYSKITYGSISELTVLTLDKVEVLRYVEENTDLNTVIRDAAALTESPCEGVKSRKRYSHGKFWLTYSPQLFEQPVNLVIPRDTLKRLEHSSEILITRTTIKRI